MILTTVLIGASAPPIYAAPFSNKQAEFRRIQAQINKIDEQLEVVVEQYNEKVLDLNKTKKELQTSNDKLQVTSKGLSERQTLMNKRLSSIYRQGSLSYIELLVSARSFEQFLYYLKLIERQIDKDTKVIAELKGSKKQMETQRTALLEKKKKQEAILAEIKAKKDKINKQLKERSTLLAKIQRELVQQRLVDARNQSRLRSKLKLSYNYGSGVSVSRGGDRSSVINLAMAELGKPYSWGASGPSSFDCSGFTSYIYKKIGVYLPHSSRAQYGYGQRVSRAQLQPGDLVFFARRGTISHVGIYVSGGSFIHSPRTGDVVKISDIDGHGGYVGAVRP